MKWVMEMDLLWDCIYFILLGFMWHDGDEEYALGWAFGQRTENRGAYNKRYVYL